MCNLLTGEDLPNFPVDTAYLPALRGRVSLTRRVHTLEYRRDKAKRSDQWMTQTAEAIGIDLDEDELYPSHYTPLADDVMLGEEPSHFLWLV